MPSSPEVRLDVLGPLAVEGAGDGAPLTPALRVLLAALAVDAPRVVSVDALMERLWEDDEGSLATLHSYVSRLRSRLGADAVVTQAPGYRLVLAPGALDAARFRALVRTARAEPDLERARAAVAEAVGLWRGAAYADVPHQFARVEASRLEEQLLEAHHLAADLDLRAGRHHQVVEDLTPLVARHPLHEALRAALVLALYRSGRQAAALEVYDQGRRILADELGVDPGSELRRLHEQVLRQDPVLDPPADTVTAPEPRTAHAAAPRPADGTATTLPEPPTALVGRDAQVAEVCAVVEGGARLVTLTGTGGVGKTRLALAAARRLRTGYDDGLVPVALAPVHDPALVLPTVTQAVDRLLGDPGPGAGEPGPDALTGLVARLRERAVLLVLDNLEHVLDAAADIAALVSACPRVSVLATSRAPLRVSGEVEHLVEPLAVPPPARAGTTAEVVASVPSVALFVERARAVSRGFRLDDHNAPAVAEICRRLGGIPLAVELVAARLRVLGPDALLARLDDALASGPRDLPERQRTMQATLEWSYRLLDPAAQRLFRGLAVFTGGFTLDLLQDVHGPDVLAPLEQLVEHSLVTAVWSEAGEPRYAVLEPTLQHARRVATGPELARDGGAHTAAVLALAERAARGYQQAEQVRWLAVVDDEHANLLAAFDRSVAGGAHDDACRIAWALWLYWWFRGHSAVGRQVAATAVALPGTTPPWAARATITLAAMAFAQGDDVASGRGWADALEVARSTDDVEAQAQCEAGLGITAITAGDTASAQVHQRRAIALGETLGEDTDGPWIVTMNHLWLGTALLAEQQREAALSHLRTGRAMADERGDRLGAFVALWYLAQAETGVDDHAALEHLRDGIRLSREVSDLANLAYFLDALVVTERAAGGGNDLERAATLLGAAQGCRERGNGRAYGFYRPDDDARASATAQITEGLGASTFDRHFERGRGWGVEDAVALAVPHG